MTPKKTPLTKPGENSPAKTRANKKEIIQKVKGMFDILPAEYVMRRNFIKKAESIAEFYGFNPIQTPHLERKGIFTRTIGEDTDIVEKEMYELKTKGGNKLVLRPEGTASIVRAYIEHGMQNKPQPVMYYYHGSFFRHERPQLGRRRELQQFGLEILGDSDSITDALVIKASLVILEEAAKLKPLCIHINSIGCKDCRKDYKKDLVTYYRSKTKRICKNCARRLKTNPLRLLDCKDEKCSEIKEGAPQIINSLCNDCTSHFKELLEILDASDISYYLDHYLVRGLDYYSRTAFEIFIEEEEPDKEEEKAKTETKEKDKGKDSAKKPEAKKEKPKPKPLALGGGGRYDSLAKAMGRKNIPAIGMAIGIDRVIDILKERKKGTTPKLNKVFLIQLGANAKHKSINVLEMLRKARISCKHSLSKNRLKSQLKIASKLKVPYTLILGQKEALEDSIIIRDMKTASQETVPIEKLVDRLNKKLK